MSKNFNDELGALIQSYDDADQILSDMSNHYISLLCANINHRVKDREQYIGNCFAHLGLIMEQYFAAARALANISYPENGKKLQ